MRDSLKLIPDSIHFGRNTVINAFLNVTYRCWNSKHVPGVWAGKVNITRAIDSVHLVTTESEAINYYR
jgi:hypothetical protein